MIETETEKETDKRQRQTHTERQSEREREREREREDRDEKERQKRDQQFTTSHSVSPLASLGFFFSRSYSLLFVGLYSPRGPSPSRSLPRLQVRRADRVGDRTARKPRTCFA